MAIETEEESIEIFKPNDKEDLNARSSRNN